MSSDLLSIFTEIEDPRVIGRSDYPLLEIIFLCISAVISGCDGWEDIEEFGDSKIDWLKQYLPYESGIPTHDTIARVISRLSPASFEKCFMEWVKSVEEITAGEIIAIDGKTLRRSHDRKNRRNALHYVNAWACNNGIALGQKKTEEKSNEITAIPQLLDLLAIKGCIVTIDAMGCQLDIADKIIKQGADYVLALKANQAGFYERVKEFLDDGIKLNFKGIEHSICQNVDKAHGRLEKRTCVSCALPQSLSGCSKLWTGLKSIACIEAVRTVNGEQSTERRYFISSLSMNAEQIAKAVRSHWLIENALHWVLDMSFREDDSRIRRGYAAENFNILRRMSLNLIKREKNTKDSVKKRRLRAGFNDKYRSNLLAGLKF